MESWNLNNGDERWKEILHREIVTWCGTGTPEGRSFDLQDGRNTPGVKLQLLYLCQCESEIDHQILQAQIR